MPVEPARVDRQDTNIERLLRSRAEIDAKLLRHRRALTVMFTDVAGSSAYFEKYGDRPASTMMHRHADLAAGIVSEFRGRVMQTFDDSLMAEFSDPDLAVHAAVNLQRRLQRRNASQPDTDRILLRIGMNHGYCFRHGDSLYGEAVNFAARITRHSGPGQILISRSVRDAVDFSSDFRCNWLGPLSIHGKGEKEDIFEVIWTDPTAYSDLRMDATVAFSRGELLSPGVRPNDFLLPASAPPIATRLPARRTPVPAAPASAPPSLAARYFLVAEIGSGATGIVYKARDRETGETVALKLLRPEFAADAGLLRRFKNELRLARKISHRNVCRIHEFNRTEESAFISMELVVGESLRQLLNRFGALPLRDGLGIARQICEGLQEAHCQGIVHCDLKPENVMVTHGGEVKLMDFGIARAVATHATHHGHPLGTPAYMAPEQAEARAFDHRADIYAAGLIFYEIFTGTPVFTAPTPLAVALKHVRETPTPPRQWVPSLPAALNDAILKCLEKDPAARFSSVGELQAAMAMEPPYQAEQPTEEAAPPEVADVEPAPVPIPWGDNTTHSFVSSLDGHNGPVYAVVFRPDGRVLASASEDRSIRFWEGGAGKEGLRISCHAYALTFSANGKILASGAGSKGAKLWDAATGRELHSFPGHSKLVRCVAISLDGHLLATGSQDATIKMWDVSSGKLLRTLSGHSGGVYAVAFSSDSQWLASGSTDKTVKLWDVRTGGEWCTLAGRGGGIYCLAFSPNGRLLAAGASDKRIKLWELETGRVLRTLAGHDGGVYSVAFSTNGLWLASGSGDCKVKIWDVASGRDLRTLAGHSAPVWAVAFSSDGRWLATGSEDSTIKLW